MAELISLGKGDSHNPGQDDTRPIERQLAEIVHILTMTERQNQHRHDELIGLLKRITEQK